MTSKHTKGDWAVFIIAHIVLIGGQAIAGFGVYGRVLAAWVAASAIIAGLAVSYIYAKAATGQTAMKILIYLFTALNAAYMVHNGAKLHGSELFNEAQVRKYEIGMQQAAQSTSLKIAGQIGLSAKQASELQQVFADETSTLASLGAFLEIFMGLIALAIGSRKSREQAETSQADPAYIERSQPITTANWTAQQTNHMPVNGAQPLPKSQQSGKGVI
jgi:hypothetical protein